MCLFMRVVLISSNYFLVIKSNLTLYPHRPKLG